MDPHKQVIQERLSEAKRHELARRAAWERLESISTNMQTGADKVKGVKALQDLETHHTAAAMAMALAVGLAEPADKGTAD